MTKTKFSTFEVRWLVDGMDRLESMGLGFLVVAAAKKSDRVLPLGSLVICCRFDQATF